MSAENSGIMFRGANSGIEFELTRENVQSYLDDLTNLINGVSTLPIVDGPNLSKMTNMIYDIAPLVEEYWPGDLLDNKVKRDQLAQCMLLLAGDYARKGAYAANNGFPKSLLANTKMTVHILNDVYREGLILSYTTADKFYELRRDARSLERAAGTHALCPAKFSKGFATFSAGVLSLIMLVVTWILSGTTSAIIGAVICFFIMRAVIRSIEAYSA